MPTQVIIVEQACLFHVGPHRHNESSAAIILCAKWKPVERGVMVMHPQPPLLHVVTTLHPARCLASSLYGR